MEYPTTFFFMLFFCFVFVFAPFLLLSVGPSPIFLVTFMASLSWVFLFSRNTMSDSLALSLQRGEEEGRKKERKQIVKNRDG